MNDDIRACRVQAAREFGTDASGRTGDQYALSGQCMIGHVVTHS